MKDGSLWNKTFFQVWEIPKSVRSVIGNISNRWGCNSMEHGAWGTAENEERKLENGNWKTEN
jgi:hypothetical protein